ncbi:Putative baseplate assembly protein OS=Rhodanobacter lindaniclasticus OX=75310 GN=B1991_13850 PE=4 SV=1 [Rhodanobacter lindaniclasticus]
MWIASTATNLKPNDRLLFVFGDLAKGGVSAIRLVQSVEVQQQSGRSKVVLQPLGILKAQIVAAAKVAIDAWAPDGTSLRGKVEQLYRGLLLGGGDLESISHLLGGFGLEPGTLAGGPPAAKEFLLAVVKAFGGGSSTNPPSTSGFGALFSALTLQTTLQPANSFRLQRSVAAALGKASDTRPQLLLGFAPQLRDSFYRAWASVPQGEPSPALSGVYALRVAAPLFGYNAPVPGSLLVKTSDGVTTTEPNPNPTDWPLAESDNVLSFDHVYDDVVADSYLVIEAPGQAAPIVARALQVKTSPRTDYGLSGKTTSITLAHASDESVWSASSMTNLRRTLVRAQSEAMSLADLVIADDVGLLPDGSPARSTGDNATRLTLGTTVDGLKAGRWVIVAGRRSDVPGTTR